MLYISSVSYYHVVYMSSFTPLPALRPHDPHIEYNVKSSLVVTRSSIPYVSELGVAWIPSIASFLSHTWEGEEN